MTSGVVVTLDVMGGPGARTELEQPPPHRKCVPTAETWEWPGPGDPTQKH